MKNIKPIFIIRLPIESFSSSDNKKEELSKVIKNTEEKLNNEYYVLLTLDQFTGGNVKFECYNSNCTEIEFQELQDKVLELIK